MCDRYPSLRPGGRFVVPVCVVWLERDGATMTEEPKSNTSAGDVGLPGGSGTAGTPAGSSLSFWDAGGGGGGGGGIGSADALLSTLASLEGQLKEIRRAREENLRVERRLIEQAAELESRSVELGEAEGKLREKSELLLSEVSAEREALESQRALLRVSVRSLSRGSPSLTGCWRRSVRRSRPSVRGWHRVRLSCVKRLRVVRRSLLLVARLACRG